MRLSFVFYRGVASRFLGIRVALVRCHSHMGVSDERDEIRKEYRSTTYP